MQFYKIMARMMSYIQFRKHWSTIMCDSLSKLIQYPGTLLIFFGQKWQTFQHKIPYFLVFLAIICNQKSCLLIDFIYTKNNYFSWVLMLVIVCGLSEWYLYRFFIVCLYMHCHSQWIQSSMRRELGSHYPM